MFPRATSTTNGRFCRPVLESNFLTAKPKCAVRDMRVRQKGAQAGLLQQREEAAELQCRHERIKAPLGLRLNAAMADGGIVAGQASSPAC